MNAGIYRLVYNEYRSLWMVVAEITKSHQSASGARRLSKIKHLLLIVFLGNTAAWAGPAADALPNLTVTTGSHTIINAPVVNPANIAGRMLIIQQADKKAILQGPSFDIGRASAVNLNHTGGVGSATLVRISGPKTTIEGALNSPNGNLFLINQNGILFGNGARVNVNGLVASALDMKDSDFLNDLGPLFAYSDGQRPAFIWGGDATGFANSLVQLEPDVQIKAALGSSVMLFAPKVINQGSIETTEGQVAMAAGSKVYISFAPDLNINGTTGNQRTGFAYDADSPYRGLAGVLVEVDPYTKKAGDAPTDPAQINGSVLNDVTGRILAQRGNVSMASFMVNQSGRVVATTSVSQKGSIRLLARDGRTDAAAPNENSILTAARSGELTFGANSVTTVLPEGSAGAAIATQRLSAPILGEPLPQVGEKSFLNLVLDALVDSGSAVTDEQIFNAPTLEAIGRTINVNDGASIVVPGGYINLSAQTQGNGLSGNNSKDTNAHLILGKNTLIDASGLKDVAVSSDRNFVEVLLTTNDLQDDPMNKNGFLYHKNVWFDIRNLPDIRVANIAGYIKQIPRSVSEKLTAAGKVNLGSEGDFVQRTGSVVDVSGGSINYTAGTHKETWVRDAFGNAFAISKAPAGVTFTGFLGNSTFRLTPELAYSEGAAAGAVALKGFAMSLDGSFKGGAKYGDFQRGSANLGGGFSLDLPINGADASTVDVDIVNNPTPLSLDFTSSDILPTEKQKDLQLSSGIINSSGFEDINIKTVGKINDNAALNLAVKSKLTLTGQQGVAIHNNIVARGGSVTATSASIDSGAMIDVSGLWVNDYINPASATGRVVTKGGSVSVSSLFLDKNSAIDVTGGGWLKSNGKVSNGDAGSIDISVNNGQSLMGELRGYALGVGGTLNLSAPSLTIGTTGFANVRDLLLTPGFFQNDGFTSFNLTASDGVLVKSGTQVDVVAKNYQLNSNYTLASTGSHVADISKTTLLPDYQRSSTSLSLATNLDTNTVRTTLAANGVKHGSVVVESGAELQVDAHGNRSDSKGNVIAPKIELSGSDNLTYIDGTLKADGGTISIGMKGDATQQTDNDFDPSQAIWLGSHAKLLAVGYTQITPNNTGLRIGTVFDGGSVSLNANKGYIVAENGSQIDVSGSGATLDVLGKVGYQATNFASNGGAVNLTAREGMLIDSTFKAASPGALGGSLNVNLGRGEGSPGLESSGLPAHYPGYSLPLDNLLPNQQWVLDVTKNAGAGFSTGLQPGDSIQTAAPGIAKISADSINTSGFSRATLKAEDVVRFDGNVNLNLASGLRLDAPTIEATGTSTVTLTAPNVMISDAKLTNADKDVRGRLDYIAPAPVAGFAKLDINAHLLDLRGQFALSGFREENLFSTNDIRLTGFSNSTALPTGMLRTVGTLNMTARQIYPTTLSDFTVAVEGAGNHAVFNGTGAHDTVLSASGKLTVNAENIDQNGVLLAPFGTISLNASQNLNLNNGSITSVAADGALIPFGLTSRDGLDYLYNYSSFGDLFASVITAPPERVVKLNAPNVAEAAGSVVDISAGGDLYAYEWVPGTGGSKDVLANGANQSAFSQLGSAATNTWAIIPSQNATFASFDAQYWSGSNIQAGDAVYLSAASGLTAGYYTLLPARYALLPGAMLVTSVSGHQDMVAGNALAQRDGSSLVSGHLAAYTSAGYVSTTRTGGFVVRPGSDAHKLAEYNDTLSSQRFAGNKNVMETLDAGRFTLAATSTLVLDGILKSLHSDTGSGAEVDVAAPNLLVVDHGSQTGPVNINGKTYLAVDENTITNMNASSLLLGGARSNGVVDVVSGEVKVGANATVSAPEVILAATDLVDVQNLATVSGKGAGSSTRNLVIGSDTIDGDGALLRVASNGAVNITRNNTDRNRGDLTIENGALVEGDGAVQLDATRNMNVAGTLGAGIGSALTLAAGRISLGSPIGVAQVTDGLWLTQTQLAPLQQVSSLAFKSYSTVDLYGGVNLGSANLDLTIQGAGISGYQNSGQTTNITARNLTLTNNDSVAFASAALLSDGTNPSLGTGSLNISTENVTSGANDVRVAGFNQTNLNASKEVIAKEKGALMVDNALTISATRVTAQTGADHMIVASGLLKIEGADALSKPVLAASNAQAANLNLRGAQVQFANGANIDAAGAKVNAEATGANTTDNVTMQSGSSILAKGSTYTLKDQSFALSAGDVTLKSNHGSVEMQSGAIIDVSPAPDGKAGTLNVLAENGTATLSGLAHGSADAQAKVDAANINNFSQTMTTLKDFAGAQIYRQRVGDVVISATDNVATKSFTLTADTGSINVNGTIDASGAKGGSIRLYAKNNLNINRGATLLAKGLADKQSTAGTSGNGGKVVLVSDGGIVSAQADDLNGVAGALIDVSGDQVGSIHGNGGSVILRAARTGAGVSINTTTTAAVTGADNLTAEAVKVYNSSTINTALQNTIASDTNAFTNNLVTTPIGLSQTRDGKLATVTPGVEIRSTGDLTLSNDWIIGDSSGTQKIPGGGILTLRAAGNLLLNNKLSYEQYSAASNVGGGPSVVSRTPSWSYRLIAGADATSASPEGIQAGAGNILVADNKYVRTGSGFIDAVAGQDISLGANAAIYTEGTPETFANLPVLSNLPAGNAAFYKEVYPVKGGDINLSAFGNVTGFADASQTGNTWMYRAALNAVGLNNRQLRWWPRYDKFVNGVGALGGGDVTVHAGADITGLQFASATNGRMAGNTTSSPDISNLRVNGGGDLNINAGGSVQNALLVAGKGLTELSAGKSAEAKFELMDASAKGYANGNLTITQVSNPTLAPSAITAQGAPGNVYFYSYGQDSSVTAVSASGDLILGKGGADTGNVGDGYYPGTLYAGAPNGNVSAEGMVLYPSSNGNATLIAGKNLNVDLRMSEVDQAVLPQMTTTPVFNSISGTQSLASFSGSTAHTQGLLHASDTTPVRLYAGNDVIFNPLAASAVILPKSVEVYAGNDVVDSNLIIQNNRATDISVIQALGNIRYTDAGKGPDGTIFPNTANLQIAGPGRLHLIAGKDVDLGSSGGVRSIGDLYNPYLTPQGADIMVLPGIGSGPNYTNMISAYLDPATPGNMASAYLPLLVSYMEHRDSASGLSENTALTEFKALNTQQQSEFINTVFYSELRAGGRDAINTANTNFGDYSRAERAILRMFPEFTSNTGLDNQPGNIMTAFQNISGEAITNPGNLNLFYSQIRSERGGSIELMVPSGLINTGLAVAGNLGKPATDLGIVSVRGGDVDAFVRNDFQVNQSRVFTLGGSDLLAYSALADIDAGRGAKTASATPPPTLRIINGQITYDFSSAVAGSGIAALTSTGGAPGTVDLFAPYGQINAGEAGIRSAGNINLGARVIIGAENISAGGVTSGVPAVSVNVSFSAPASPDSNSTNKQGEQLGAADKLGENSKMASLLSLISVEVLSLGDGALPVDKPDTPKSCKDDKNNKDCAL